MHNYLSYVLRTWQHFVLLILTLSHIYNLKLSKLLLFVITKHHAFVTYITPYMYTYLYYTYVRSMGSYVVKLQFIV